MARKTAVKMGSLNLLLLIIAICLAVLSVLSFVTARAELNLTEKQSLYVQDTYAEEMAAQHFISLVDIDLEVARDGRMTISEAMATTESNLFWYIEESTASKEAVDCGITGEARMVSIESIIKDLRISGSNGNKPYEKSGNDWIIDSDESDFNDPAAEALLFGSSLGLGSANDGSTDASSDGQAASQDSANASAVTQTDGLPASYDRFLLEDVGSTCVGGVQVIFTSASGRTLDCLIGVRKDGTYIILDWRSSHTWIAEESMSLWTGN